MTISEAYKVLGVNRQSSMDDIKSKYRKLVIEFHPDKNKTDTSFKFQQVKTAYELLKTYLNDTKNIHKNTKKKYSTQDEEYKTKMKDRIRERKNTENKDSLEEFYSIIKQLAKILLILAILKLIFRI